jgi:hypothetical protein
VSEETFDFGQMLSDLEAEKRRLFDRRITLETDLAEVITRFEHVTNAIRNVTPLTGVTDGQGEDISALGITDAIRYVLRSGDAMSAAEIYKNLGSRGFDLSRYSSPMASIYKILRRLMDDSKEVVRVSVDDDGRPPYQYRWAEPVVSDDDIPF